MKEPRSPASGFNIVGKRTPLVDALPKAAGTAVYVDDIKLPGMLVARVLRSPHAHARIRAIDTSKAEALPGVRAVVTGAEAPTKFGVLPLSKDETAMAVDRARFVGHEVAAVAADDEEIADAALRLIAVDYEVLPAFVEPEQAVKPVPPEHKIHDYTKFPDNTHRLVQHAFGDLDGAFRSAAATADGRFKMAGLSHAFTEPHAVLAHFEPTGRLTVWSCQQVPHYLHRALAEVLGMPMHRIRVIKPTVGGGFGGKSDPFPHEILVAMLSRKCGRPVKLRLDREEVYFVHRGRHPTKTKLAIAADADGKLTGMDLDVVIDGGAFGSFGIISSYYNGVLSQAPYRFETFRYNGRRVYTNKPPSGAMRGHGAVNTRFALETLLDELAEKLGLDPVELRRRNLIPPNSTTINGFRITSNGIAQCIDECTRRSGWAERRGKLPYGRGLGIGCGFYISGSALPIHWTKLPQSTVHLKIDMDGGITLHTGASEIGQGSDTMAAQMVAEVLGVPIDMVRVVAVDTDLSPVDLGSYSSRVTFMNGNAAIEAASKIRDKLGRAAEILLAQRTKYGVPREYLDFADGWIYARTNPELRVSYMEALTLALENNGALVAKGVYQSPPLEVATHKGAAAGLSPTYSFSAYVADVEVDPDTGYVRVHKIWAAHDCGRSLNPIAVEGQIEGSIHMGLGQALMEELRFNKGQPLEPNLLDYRTLSAKQMPEVEVIVVETNDPEGPFGAKEVGEGPLAPVIPAVANAIYDAVGVRLRELPMTPDRVLEAIDQKRDKPALAHAAE
ncbi:MAG: molybdopterin-dependent oxidoreductase [Deltaproteobacteria bacterium]|nr:molybdopterin-dependent oxidoreductase [Deltaproteobacteria bacterium]